MNEETKLAPDLAISDRGRRAETLIENMLRNDEVYHAHKENMANAGIAVMLALLGAVVAMKDWPDAQWIPNLTIFIPKRWTAFLGFSALWLLIHIFVRWQLRYRRFAAIRQAAALRALTQWILRVPQPSDITLPDAPTNVSSARAPSLFLIPSHRRQNGRPRCPVSQRRGP